MHSDQPYFPGNPMLPLADQMGYHMQNAPMASMFNGIKPLMPLHNVNIQPSNTCPRNYIIFDQTYNRSQIMFHPEISSKFLYPGFGFDKPIVQDNVAQKDANDETKTEVSSPLKEDSDDIDALLSTEYEENEECDDEDDDVVSTARTNAIYECNSPDSCSNYETLSRKRRTFFKNSSGNEKKRHKMRKMVKALKGIVPGANRMSTVAVLDEAVRYLKSLRVEVQKLGVGNSNG
ncbi:hypothetical protein BUALT_Bualt18G0123400 [Buddleja alternifolia]|uniref:BHLH domain-containing protein n=1 Tax=Buddleja alternifolia TaxID=168488 RepID=A0AAV6WAR4_9LAMI|nr:hypothetical protein BUALT_Bualt18G0123400 [Buddleja alternifolia]